MGSTHLFQGRLLWPSLTITTFTWITIRLRTYFYPIIIWIVCVKKPTTHLTVWEPCLVIINLYRILLKPKHMLFASRNITLNNVRQLSFNNKDIIRVYHRVLLGLVSDHQLTWHLHVKYITRNLYKKIPSLYRLRHILHLLKLLMLYRSFVHSHNSYGIALYGLTYKTTTKHVQTAQNAAIRALPFLNRRHSVLLACPLLTENF